MVDGQEDVNANGSDAKIMLVWLFAIEIVIIVSSALAYYLLVPETTEISMKIIN